MLVAVGLLSGQSWVAIGIVAAPSLSLLVVPLAFARRARKAKRTRIRIRRRSQSTSPEADSDFSLKQGGGFAAAVLVIMFSEQAFLNAGPLIIRGLQDAAAAGFIFNVLMIARAPLQLFQAVSTSILPHLTRLHTSSEPDSEREFHRSVRVVLLGVAAFTAFTALVVLVAGPQLMQLAFSDKFTYDRAGLLLVTLGMGLYLASVTLNQACLAQGQVRRAAARWLACAAVLHRLELPAARRRRVPPRRDRLRAHRRRPLRPPLPRLPPPARTRRGRARGGLARGARGAPRVHRRVGLTLARVGRWVDTTPS